MKKFKLTNHDVRVLKKELVVRKENVEDKRHERAIKEVIERIERSEEEI